MTDTTEPTLTAEEQATAAALADPQALALLDQQNSGAEAVKPVKPAAKKPVAKKAEPKEADADADYPTFLQSTTNFPYVDPQSGIRFSPGSPIKVDVAPKAGSWLDSQIKAGFIGKA
jgi:hypothetical protein